MLTQMLGRLIIISLSPFALAQLATAAELTTAEEIDGCYRSNFPDSTAVQTVSLAATDRLGAVNTSRATLHWKKFNDGQSKVMMRFARPAEMRGAGLLIVEKKNRNDLFMYLPELDRVKRVTRHMTSASMFGTDFSYEEFERIQGMSMEGSFERLDDDEIDGRATYVLVTRPAEGEESGYERIKSWIDKESCAALRTEFFEHGEKPRKVMTTAHDKVVQNAGIWVPMEIVMHDHRDQTQTTLLVEEIEIGGDVPLKMFSEKELLRGAH